MRNEEQWEQTMYVIDKKGNLHPDEQSLKGGSYVPITLTCEVMNKIGRKYLSGKLLDLGCGHVPFHNWYKNCVEEDVCMDWADTTHKNELLDVVHDINNDFPFEGDTFDSIISSAVMEHIYNPFHMFQECHRILKKGGYFMINTVLSYCEHEEPFDYLRHTQFFMKRLAEETGFEICEFETHGDGLCVMADIAAKILLVKPKSIPFRILNKILRCLFNIYHLRKKTVVLKSYPVGYTVVLKKI